MSKYNIPAEYERYNDIVDNLVDKYTRLVEEDLATFESSNYDQRDAEGFIKLNALRLKKNKLKL